MGIIMYIRTKTGNDIMKKTGFILLVIAIVIVTGCNSEINTIENGGNSENIIGVGPVIEREISVSDFSKLSNIVFVEFNISFGETTSLKVSGQRNILDLIQYRKENDKLIIEPMAGKSFSSTQNMKAEIVVKEITEIYEIGAALYNLKNGNADELNITIIGGAVVNAENYQVKNCNINITGAGICRVFVTDNLEASIIGSGVIYYKGEPNVKSTIVGTGVVKKFNN